MNYLEKLLAVNFKREYCKIVGSGTIGIYLSLKALGLKNQLVAIPNNVCYNVPLAVILSGNSPIYIDIDLETLSLSPKSLKNHINMINAVIAVHGYGNMCDIDSIDTICKNRKIPLIEDCCLSYGANFMGRPAGSYGDISILSFGSSKIIDVGHGGAILSNDESLLNEIMQLETNLPLYSSEHRKSISQLGIIFKNIYNSFYLNGLNKVCSTFINELDKSKEAFLFKFSDLYLEKIYNEVKFIENNIFYRKRNFERINEFLSEVQGEFIDIKYPTKGSVIWRACLFVKDRRNELLKFLLQKKYEVSSWYPSIDIFFRKNKSQRYSTPNSDWVSDHIVNLLVSKKINNSYLYNISQDIIKFYKEDKKYD
tara:strand:+ start:95 stop:1198 length:1104 start_codon:yes stop_codon:yes gene_type:complete